jgi:hypothetical protein
MTVEGVRKDAQKHYNCGGDVIVECWDDRDIQEFLDDTPPEKQKQQLLQLYRINDDRRDW